MEVILGDRYGATDDGSDDEQMLFADFSKSEDFQQEESYASIEVPDDIDAPLFSFKKLWAFTGPGFLMSIAYLDPGNIESDLQAGAVAGYSLLWVLFWATVIGLALQILSARLGVVTGMHLAQVCRVEYPRVPRLALWIMTELAIIGSDIQEVIGSAIALRIISQGAIPLWGGVLITGADTFTFMFLEQYGLRKLEFFFGALITIMACSFGYMYGNSDPDHLAVMKGIAVPYVHANAVIQAVGLIGAVVMPHNLYLYSALVLSRNVDKKNKRKVREANFYYAIEGSIALLVSFVINMFVVAVFARAFSDEDLSSDDINLLNAGDRLEAKYGTTILYIWAAGLLAAGQSSTMTGTYAGQFVMDGFLNLKMVAWKRVLLTRSVAILPTVLVAAFTNGVLDHLDEWLNVLQSLQLPFAILPVLHFTGSKRIMGSFYNGNTVDAIIWVIAMSVIGINVYLVISTIETVPQDWYLYLIIAAVLLFYVILVGYLVFRPLYIYMKAKRAKSITIRSSESPLL